jgi:hypothetical protein
MRTLTLVFGLAALLGATFPGGSGTAQAQHMGTKQEQTACSRDAQRFCRKELGDDNAVQQCLQTKRASLSSSCKKVFQSHGM